MYAVAFEITLAFSDTHLSARTTNRAYVFGHAQPTQCEPGGAPRHCPNAPVGVIEGSRADVSFIAGLLIDKFAYHLPFYRQHQRLGDGGITVTGYAIGHEAETLVTGDHG